MSELLKARRLSIVPTMRCTLQCKLCSNHMPEFKAPQEVPVAEIKRDVDDVFALFDYVEWLQFVGGEIFTHPHMAEVYRYCMRYMDQFDKLILETNATLLPRQEELDALREYGERVQIMISDYGPLSRRRDEVIALYAQNGIPCVAKKYYGEDQHFGGWIDNTALRHLGEAPEVVAEKAAGCAQVRIKNMHCYQGKLHRCSNSLFLYELGLFTPNADDFLDLRDARLTREQRREIVAGFYTHPRKSCEYCTWKDTETLPRYPAAEQVERDGAKS